MKTACMICKNTNGINCSCMPIAAILIWDFIGEKKFKEKGQCNFTTRRIKKTTPIQRTRDSLKLTKQQ